MREIGREDPARQPSGRRLWLISLAQPPGTKGPSAGAILGDGGSASIVPDAEAGDVFAQGVNHDAHRFVPSHSQGRSRGDSRGQSGDFPAGRCSGWPTPGPARPGMLGAPSAKGGAGHHGLLGTTKEMAPSWRLHANPQEHRQSSNTCGLPLCLLGSTAPPRGGVGDGNELPGQLTLAAIADPDVGVLINAPAWASSVSPSPRRGGCFAACDASQFTTATTPSPPASHSFPGRKIAFRLRRECPVRAVDRPTPSGGTALASCCDERLPAEINPGGTTCQRHRRRSRLLGLGSGKCHQSGLARVQPPHAGSHADVLGGSRC
jgi:hypothetical protein